VRNQNRHKQAGVYRSEPQGQRATSSSTVTEAHDDALNSTIPRDTARLDLHIIMHPGQITEHGDPLLALQQRYQR
jgi:hypothetical protein